MKIASKPYDNLEMLFAFHISEKARARQERYIQQFPEHLRDTEKRRYTLERAVKESAESAGARFGVNLIPHTLAVTTLGGIVAGRQLNLEVDLLARYVQRALAP